MKTRYLSALTLLVAASLAHPSTPLSASAQSTYNDAVVGYTEVFDDGQLRGNATWNRAGESVTATHPGQGQYSVAFAGVQPEMAGPGHLQVTASDFPVNALCSVQAWTFSGVDLVASILCYDVDGAPVDSDFSLLLLDEGNATGDNETLAFAWSNDANPAGGELDLTNNVYTHNPAGGSTTLFHDATGVYHVVFEDLADVMTTGMHVQVTPYSAAPRFCFTANWEVEDGDVTVPVYCQSGPGSSVNSRFNVLVTSGQEEAPGFAYAFMDQPNGPSGQWPELTNDRTFNPFGTVRVNHLGVGTYGISFANLSGSHGGNLVVTPYNITGVSCKLRLWAWNDFDIPVLGPNHQDAIVECFTAEGDAMDAAFTVLSTFVNPGPFNDMHRAAFPLAGGAGTYAGSNVHASEEAPGIVPAFDCLLFFTAADVWWSFIASDDGAVTVSTEGSGFDTVLSINTTDGSGGFGVELECNDDAPGEDWSILEDVPIEAGEEYLIRVGSEGNAMGNFPVGSIVLNVESSVIVADEATPEALEEMLSFPSPNPVRGTSMFTVAVETGQNLTVELFDALGRRVETLYDGALTGGMSEALTLDASTLPAGVYVIRAQGEDFIRSRRVTVVR